MGLSTYTIDRFIGINQSADENRLSPVFSYDAANMDTTDGKLSVAKGYKKHINAPVPGSEPIDRLFFFKGEGFTVPVVITGEKLYAYKFNSWELIYTYTHIAGTKRYESLMARIGNTVYLIVADGLHQLIKYDGNAVTLFGSAENCSDIHAAYLALYRGRLFSAGDYSNPNRIYYSCLPGGNRSIENWGYIEASPDVEGGHAEVGSAGGDRITAIKALSNQLLIFCENSLYRLIGDRPSNFIIERIDAGIGRISHTSIAQYRDNLYFVTNKGLYYYNGVTARPSGDIGYIKKIMEASAAANSKAVIAGDKLYFTLKRRSEFFMIEYDLAERKYMLRNGFGISDIAALSDSLMLINSARYVYIFGYGESYDGLPINAYWNTPLTDFQDKAAIKTLRELYVRGQGGVFCVETGADDVISYYRASFPESGSRVLEIPLETEGRCVQLKFRNEGGGAFTIEGGAEISMGIRKRTV